MQMETKEWKLTFKVIKQRGEAKYSVDAVVNGSLTNMPYSTSIMVDRKVVEYE